MSELIRKNASELADLLAKGEVSSVEITQAHIDQISSVGDAIHSFLHLTTDKALEVAKEVDRRRSA